MTNSLVSIVMPAHNEEDALPRVVPEVIRAAAGYHLEVLIVDDGSTDGTWKQIQALRQVYPEGTRASLHAEFRPPGSHPGGPRLGAGRGGHCHG